VCFDIKECIGKVRAINEAVHHVKTPYVLLLDDDTLIDPTTVIPTSLLDEGYAGVALRVHIRKNGWLSEIQAHEYRKGSDIGKRRHNKHSGVQNISGAVGLYTNKELLRQTMLHTGEFAGEYL
jgi:cellulose synthase/poly-beta-1,6-N-acetylglucosamine synthase-like glycosyltransferase